MASLFVWEKRSMSWNAEDARMMRRALKLAERGKGATSPNPPVGAVVAARGGVVGEGYHHRAGEAHAEVLALDAAARRARGGTLYVTLEPCNHQGRTGPCTERIIASGIKRVIVARRDPNPWVTGKGLERLAKADLEVACGLLEEPASELSEAYEKHVKTGMPFILMKIASTADGRIATRTGESKWISGAPARRLSHTMRRESDAILVGRGTVEKDDPALDVRDVPSRGHRPLRVVLDSHAALDLRHRVFTDGGSTLLVATRASDPARRRQLREMGVEVLLAPQKAGQVDLSWLMRKLGERGLLQVMVEGGAQVFTGLVSAGLADKLVLFMAPRLFGGGSLSWVDDLGVVKPEEGPPFAWKSARKVGDDVMLVGYWGKD